jgi:predicted RND superfamily exporter protein
MANIGQIVIITVLCAAIVFRSLLAGLLVAVPLAVSVLIDFGVMGVAEFKLDVASAAVLSMAVGIGADYAIYFLFRLREEYCTDGDYGAALGRCFRSAGKAILFVSSAVGAGYSVLCFSGFRLFVQLGILVGLAMITSSAACLLIIPAILTLAARLSLLEVLLPRPKDVAVSNRTEVPS